VSALLCSILHYIFFDQLQGSIASGDNARISQSYTTAISLLLVTLFKASLLGSVGVCSAQYLWRVLRGKPIALAKVESLFQMRHSLLELVNPRVILTGSFLIAAYTWLVPLAALYPPGALTIAATPFPLTKDVRMSVPEVSFLSNFNSLQYNASSRLARISNLSHRFLGAPVSPVDNKWPKVNVSTTAEVAAIFPFLAPFAKHVVSTGEIIFSPPPSVGVNASYILEFMGPQLSCQRVGLFNHTALPFPTDDPIAFTDLVLGDNNGTINDAFQLPIRFSSSWPIVQNRILATLECGSKNGATPEGTDQGGVGYLVETSRTDCRIQYVTYKANITYTKGVRSMEYTTQPVSPEATKAMGFAFQWETSAENQQKVANSSVNAYLADLLVQSNPKFAEQMKSQLRFWNAFSIYAAFLQTITGVTHIRCNQPVSPLCDAEWTRPNGAVVGIAKPYFCGKPDKCMSPILSSRLRAWLADPC
jgi:hypothetical protein